jgi:hypothetical protein
MATLGCTAVPLIIAGLAYLTAPDGSTAAIDKHVQSAWILAVSLAITGYTAVFTVAIGCVVVWIMKGPAYVADRYELVDAEQPARRAGGSDRHDRESP